MSPRAQTDASRLRNLREPSDALHAPGGYFTLSTKPLYALIFVLPLVVFYEIGVSRWLGPAVDVAAGEVGVSGGGGGDIRARKQLIDFFELAGVNGSIAAGALLITVLLLMHVFSGDRWSIKPRVLAGMVLESAILTMPMIVLGHLLASMLGVNGSASMLVEGASATAQASPVMRSATIAVGAGLYEELLFRLIGIAIVHLLLVDLAGIKDRTGQLLAVLFTAILFAFYHESGYLSDADPGTIAYYTVLGLCFGGIYLTRGFGIAVGVHVLFDAVILILLS